jgi:hypothetical protein
MFWNEMGSKTPVSILQEMCIQKGSLPQYQLIHDGGRSCEAFFKYRVLVGEATGTYKLLLRAIFTVLSALVQFIKKILHFFLHYRRLF